MFVSFREFFDRYSLTIARWLTALPGNALPRQNYTTPRDATGYLSGLIWRMRRTGQNPTSWFPGPGPAATHPMAWSVFGHGSMQI